MRSDPKVIAESYGLLGNFLLPTLKLFANQTNDRWTVMNTNIPTLLNKIWLSASLSLIALSCASKQPDYECAAMNHSIYQIRYYQLTDCGASASKFLTGALVGDTAGMETYVLITPDGGGGPNMEFRDVDGKLDRSATPLGLRLGNLVSSTLPKACNLDFRNDCTTPDEAFDPDLVCKYCVNIVGDGGPGTTYTLSDGTNAEDTPLPDGGRQGVRKALPDGGTKRVSLENKCDPGKLDDVVRTSDLKPSPNLFFKMPRFGVDGICIPFDGGVATSQSVFPEVDCQDSTVFPKVTITTTLKDFKLVSSPRILGNLAKGTVTFEETNGSDKCTSTYKIVILNPQVSCLTDFDCSPDPVPNAPDCTETSTPDDFCLSGKVTTTVVGSGITPNLFRKYPDGGFDLRNTCDRDLNICIWDADAGI